MINNNIHANNNDIFITIILAVLPAFVLMYYVYKRDRVNKEPINLLTRLFIAGMLIVIPVFIVEYLISALILSNIAAGSILFNFLSAFLCAAFTEELFKYFVNKKIAWNHEAFDSTFDGMIYCVFTSMGFASIENIMYSFSFGREVLPYRAFLAIPGHFAFGIVMGVYMSKAKQIEIINYYYDAHLNYKKFLKLSLLSAILFHGCYDFCLMQGSDAALIAFGILVILMYYFIYYTIKTEARKDRLF